MKDFFCQNIWLTVPFSLALCLSPLGISSQCSNYTKVMHLSGTQQVGCVGVTVTSQGDAGNQSLCGIGPYMIGFLATGSYTFTFDHPVNSVKIDFLALSNHPGEYNEELTFEINGSFYPITVPGLSSSACQFGTPAEITPWGTIQACAGCGNGNWRDMIINENISSIKIENTQLFGIAGGSMFDIFICAPPSVTDAGEIVSPPLSQCPDEVAEVPAATGTVLGSDDVLSYILFPNQANPPGSILSIGPDPVFTFNPATMQTGVTYYIAAIAGNNLNGNVDLADPCLDISNIISTVWRPLPTVSFSVPDENACPGGCKAIKANFTGTPPFSLTYATPNGLATQSFSASPGNFEVCIAPGTPEGNWQVDAVSVSDAHCTCH